MLGDDVGVTVGVADGYIDGVYVGVYDGDRVILLVGAMVGEAEGRPQMPQALGQKYFMGETGSLHFFLDSKSVGHLSPDNFMSCF